MKYTRVSENPPICMPVNETGAPLLTDTQSALDLLVSARYECGCDKLVLQKQDVAEEFFDLKTRIAGDILQKFVNYGFAIAIVGDFSGYTSKALRDFIYESNNGTTVFFVPTAAQAVEKLGA